MAKEIDLGGRPTKYLKKYETTVYKLALLNLTNKEIADVLEITISTFYEWKKKYPGFSDALRKGGKIADADMSASLHKRGKGFSYTETKEEYERIPVVNEDGNPTNELVEVLVKTTKTKKTVPPDTGAIALWMGNRTRKNENKWSTRPDNVKTDDTNDKAERAAQIIKELLGED